LAPYLRPWSNVRNGTHDDCVDVECGELGGEVQRTVQNAQLDRAEQTRLQAEEMTIQSARCQMLQIAAGYRLLAHRAEERAARANQKPSALVPK
jgi:hypothetical protein